VIGSYFVLEDKAESITFFTNKALPQVSETMQIRGEVIYVTLGTTNVIALVETDESETKN
jgi:hypothetical protein